MNAIVIDTLKQELQQGRVTADRLLNLLAAQQRTLQAVLHQLQAVQQRCAELEQKLGGPPTPKLEQPFSLRAEEKRQAAGQPKPKRRRK